MALAPIALFAYNRPTHTQKCIEALHRNMYAKESDIYIFSDAASNEDSIEGVEYVRRYLKTLKGFKSITVIERDENYGLTRSLTSGVTELINAQGSIIVVEDDLISSPFFLKYMNDGLNYYESEQRVISIHGYCYPVKGTLPQTFFLQGADCWGWATWQRGWNLFQSDGPELLRQLKSRKLEKAFDLNGAYPYTQMLKKQVAGKNKSWAILWYASAFLHGKLTLYPGKSLICNIGNDNSGTHCIATNAFDANVTDEPVPIGNIPIKVNLLALKEIEAYLKSIRFRRILNRISNFFTFA